MASSSCKGTVLAVGIVSCLRLGVAGGNEGKDSSEINKAQIDQRFLDGNQHLDFLFP